MELKKMRKNRGQMRIVEAFIACCLILMGHFFLSSTTSTMTRAKTAELQTLVQNLLNTLGDRDVLINIVEGQEGAASSLRQLVESILPPDMLFNVTLTSLVTNSILANATNMYYTGNASFGETVSMQGMNTVTIPIQMRKSAPLDVVLTLDRSQSMGDKILGDEFPKIEYAASGMCLFVDFCDNATDRVGLVTFHTTSNIERDLTNDTEKLKQTINQVSPHGAGQSNITIALGSANVQLLEARLEAVKAIILITDGLDSIPEWAIAQANIAKNRGTRIYVIGLGEKTDLGEELLMEIQSDGYFYAPSGRDLEYIYTVMARELTQFVETDIVLITITLMKT